jgi:hypothetical protein
MSVFQLPKTLCNEINSMIAKFWGGRGGGHKDNDKKVAWMSWEKMGKAKEVGRLGFQDLECFNAALLAKQGWQLIQNLESLVARILKEKYHPNNMFLDSPLSRNPSYVWQSIWNAKFQLDEGMLWRVGNGRSIKIWGDKWLPSLMTFAIQSLVHILDSEAKVCELIGPDMQWWNIPLIKENFMEEVVEKICSMAICPRTQHDRAVWMGNKNDDFSVRSAYHLAKDLCSRKEVAALRCHIKTHLEEIMEDSRAKSGENIFVASMQQHPSN